jgi:hypothetical protein
MPVQYQQPTQYSPQFGPYDNMYNGPNDGGPQMNQYNQGNSFDLSAPTYPNMISPTPSDAHYNSNAWGSLPPGGPPSHGYMQGNHQAAPYSSDWGQNYRGVSGNTGFQNQHQTHNRSQSRNGNRGSGSKKAKGRGKKDNYSSNLATAAVMDSSLLASQDNPFMEDQPEHENRVGADDTVTDPCVEMAVDDSCAESVITVVNKDDETRAADEDVSISLCSATTIGFSMRIGLTDF